VQKFPLRTELDRYKLIEWEKIFYIEAEGDDSLVRLAEKTSLRHIEPLGDLEPRLPSPPFFRIHRSYLVNLDRAFEIRERDEGEYELKMDPPVNKVLPISRLRYAKLRELLDL
jgi:DNA-binding LytR/AlgR family response regulator